MRWARRFATLTVALLAGTLHTQALAPDDGGGRDVSVALFSTQILHRVTLTPLSPDAWTARCARCTRSPLTAPLHVFVPGDIFAGGALRVTDDDTSEQRSATGIWHLRVNTSPREIDVVLRLPTERYVASVLNGEALPNEPIASLRALARVARTYALTGSHYAAPRGHLAADLCDSTQCQAMRFGSVPWSIEQAVRDTAGETIWFGNRRAEVFCSQNCGGTTEDVSAVWPKLHDPPYLRSHADPYCLRRDSAAWHAEVPADTVLHLAHDEGWRFPTNIISARVLSRSSSHRALSIRFVGANGQNSAVSASALRFAIDRKFGWNRLRSDLYEIAVRGDSLIFDGHGHGHGVGLCQTGATEMAVEGRSDRDILRFYFPATTVRIGPDDQGWQDATAGPVRVRSAQALSDERRELVLRTWTEAKRRFSPRHEMTPEIVFAPSSELFRQLTSQPGWMLASTRENVTVMQPDQVFHNNGVSASLTLLHEMLHILVEAEANQRTPMWLREGLVEVLAGEPGLRANDPSTNATDTALSKANSQADNLRAHLAAGRRVDDLLKRYGLSTVRSWLWSGVPAAGS